MSWWQFLFSFIFISSLPDKNDTLCLCRLPIGLYYCIFSVFLFSRGLFIISHHCLIELVELQTLDHLRISPLHIFSFTHIRTRFFHTSCNFSVFHTSYVSHLYHLILIFLSFFVLLRLSILTITFVDIYDISCFLCRAFHFLESYFLHCQIVHEMMSCSLLIIFLSLLHFYHTCWDMSWFIKFMSPHLYHLIFVLFFLPHIQKLHFSYLIFHDLYIVVGFESTK